MDVPRGGAWFRQEQTPFCVCQGSTTAGQGEICVNEKKSDRNDNSDGGGESGGRLGGLGGPKEVI